MKTKILLLITVSCFLLFSCDNDDDTNSSMSTDEVMTSASVDDVSDDVIQVVDSQSNELEYTGKSKVTTESFLTNCATITTVKTENTWVRTIDFGKTNCTLYNGNTVRGKIIITFTNDFNALTRTIAYSFDNFYHNDRHIEGNRTVVKKILENGRPQATISLNLTVTNVDGSVIKQEGSRVREFTQGYDTPYILADNVFSITGKWTTTLPNGVVHTATVTSPLIVKWSCPHIVSGTISIVRNTATAVLDYGNGDCDKMATLTINDKVYNLILGK